MHTIEGGFIIEEEEAKTVKYIFLATLCGYTAEEIAEVLTDKQRPTLRGRTEWTASMVKAIMENERRWGDLEVRKRVVIDYKEKVTAKNDGLREGAYIPHYHEGIVSPEIARAAHMMRASRYKFGSVPDVYVIDSGALKGFVSAEVLSFTKVASTTEKEGSISGTIKLTINGVTEEVPFSYTIAKLPKESSAENSREK